MTAFLTLQAYLLNISLLLRATVCIFFMLNIQQYEISIGPWLTFLLPTNIANRLNESFAIVGTLALIIPLTIIILAVLMPANIPIKVAGSFFGITGTLFITLTGIFRITLTEVYHMKVLLVTKVMPLS